MTAQSVSWKAVGARGHSQGLSERLSVALRSVVSRIERKIDTRWRSTYPSRKACPQSGHSYRPGGAVSDVAAAGQAMNGGLTHDKTA